MKLVKITVLCPEDKNEIAKLAARKLHNTSLHHWLQRQIDSLIRAAREQMPDCFALPVELTAIDRTILLILTTQGRRTAQDLQIETGVHSQTIRASLDRLVKSGLVYVREQGGKTEEARGFRKKIYISHKEE